MTLDICYKWDRLSMSMNGYLRTNFPRTKTAKRWASFQGGCEEFMQKPIIVNTIALCVTLLILNGI